MTTKEHNLLTQQQANRVNNNQEETNLLFMASHVDGLLIVDTTHMTKDIDLINQVHRSIKCTVVCRHDKTMLAKENGMVVMQTLYIQISSQFVAYY